MLPNSASGSLRRGSDRSQSLMAARLVSGSPATEPIARKGYFEETPPSSEVCHKPWIRELGQAWSGWEARVEEVEYGVGRWRAMWETGHPAASA